VGHSRPGWSQSQRRSSNALKRPQERSCELFVYKRAPKNERAVSPEMRMERLADDSIETYDEADKQSLVGK
jgi:hypothetical protein